MATVTDAGLDLLARWTLGIADPEPLVVALFIAPDLPTGATLFDEFTLTGLPGGGAVTLVPGNWSGFSVPSMGDYVYPIIGYTFGITVGGDTLLGYVVYSAVSSTALWFEVFEFPQVIPPSGGAMFLNLQFRDVNRV